MRKHQDISILNNNPNSVSSQYYYSEDVMFPIPFVHLNDESLLVCSRKYQDALVVYTSRDF